MRVIGVDTDIDKMYEGLKDEFMEKAHTDDFWIDDMWTEDSDLPIDWMPIIAKGGIIDRVLLAEAFAGGDEFGIKTKFLSDGGCDITEESLGGVYVYDAGSENWVEGNWGVSFPDIWLYDTFGDMYPDEGMVILNWNYFEVGAACVFSDDVPNGVAKYDRIGDYFVWAYDV